MEQCCLALAASSAYLDIQSVYYHLPLNRVLNERAFSPEDIKFDA